MRQLLKANRRQIERANGGLTAPWEGWPREDGQPGSLHPPWQPAASLRRALEQVTRELDSARQTQRSLLPEADPVIAGFDIAGWSRAASATGGDFYDYVSLPGGHLGLVLADVMGHGLASSLLACECRALVRAMVSMTDSVETIITHTNEILHADLKAERFVTMFIGDLDPSTGALGYVSAGQGPLLHWRDRDGTCRQLGVTTLPLGLFPTIDGRLRQLVTLEPGDVFVLATDGLNEWSNPRNEMFGMSRLSHLIQQARNKPAAEIINSLLEAVMTFASGTPQEDDLTAIVVRRL